MSLEDLFNLKISNIISGNVFTVNENDLVLNVVKKMESLNVGAVIIVDKDERIKGIFTERDVLKRITAKEIAPSKTHIRDVMTENPKGLRIDAPILSALKVMQQNNFRHLPIIDGAKLVGIISIKDITKAITNNI